MGRRGPFATGGGLFVDLAKLSQIVIKALTDAPPSGHYKFDLIIDKLEIVRIGPAVAQPSIQIRSSRF